MPTSQSGSKNRHIQIFRDDEQDERTLACLENDNRWLNDFLARLASTVQTLGKKNKGAVRGKGDAF